MEINTNKKIIIIVLVIVLIILSAICVFGLMNNDKEDLIINDINIQKDAFGIYNLIGHITPQKDFDYLEARITFYDNSGTVIGKSPIAWNTIDAKADEKLSLGNGMGGVCDGTPAYAIVEFYDYTGSDTPIANATIQFNGNNTNATANMTSDTAVSQSNTNNDDNQYSQDDLDLAKSEGYAEGYSDSLNDNYYYDDTDYDDYSGSSSSGGSSSSDSASSSGSSSGGSSVETTTDE